MADYLTARAAIAARIATVNITTPVTLTIARVYETLGDGDAVNEFPSVLITGYASRTVRGPSSFRQRQYMIGLKLHVKPKDGATIRAQLDAFKEAISVTFDGFVTLGLGGGYHVEEGPNWLSKEPLTDSSGVVWDEGEIVFSIKDAAAFAA